MFLSKKSVITVVPLERVPYWYDKSAHLNVQKRADMCIVMLDVDAVPPAGDRSGTSEQQLLVVFLGLLAEDGFEDRFDVEIVDGSAKEAVQSTLL